MKTAAIITFINNYNFGSTLQAYALKRAIEDLGWQAYHLNYAPSKLEKLKNLLLSGNSPKLILEGILRRRGWDSEKNLAFDFFQDTYLDKTDPLSSHAQLAEDILQSAALPILISLLLDGGSVNKYVLDYSQRLFIFNLTGNICDNLADLN